MFIDTTEALLELLERNYLDLGLVRYTKAQAVQLKKKVSPEETVILDSILTQRRVYSKARSGAKNRSLLSVAEAQRLLEQEHIKSGQLAALYASGVTLNAIRELRESLRDEKLRKMEMVPLEVPSYLYVDMQ